MKPALRKIVDAIDRNESLPAVAASVSRLVRLAESDTEAIQALVDVISMDVSLTHRILTIANGAFYGHSGAVGSLGRAVIVLGFNAVRSLALNLTLLDKLQDPSQRDVLQLEMAHSLLAGLLARRLAEQVGPSHSELCEVTALLQSIGRLLAAAFAHAEMKQLRDQSMSRKVSRSSLALEMLGATFEDITREALRTMDLPDVYRKAALSGEETFSGRVAVQAGALAEALLDGGLTLADPRVGGGLDLLAESFDIKKDKVVHLAGTALDEFESTCRVLKLPVQRGPSSVSKPASMAATLDEPEPAHSLGMRPEVVQVLEEIGVPLDVKERLNSVEGDVRLLLESDARIDRLLATAVDGIQGAVGYRSVVFFRWAGEDLFKAQAASGNARQLAQVGWQVRIGRGMTIVDAAVSRGLAIHLRNLEDLRIKARLPDWVKVEMRGARAMVLLPVMCGSRCAGLVYADRAAAEPDELTAATGALSRITEVISQGLLRLVKPKVLR